MFYITLLLRTIIYALNRVQCYGNINDNENTNISIKTRNVDAVCKLAHKITENNSINNEIYGSIVQKFVEEHILDLAKFNKTPIDLLYKLPTSYKPNDITKLCNELEETPTKFSCDKFYHFYMKLFIESAHFSLGTIKTVFELHQKLKENNTECRKALEANPSLFDDFVISINWLNSHLEYKHEIHLLYDYDHFHTYYDYISNKIIFLYQYYFTSYITSDSVAMTNLVKYIQQYYKENDFTSNQKIIENESIEKIREWIDSNNEIQNKGWYKTLAKAAINRITLFRSTQTKINYLSKPNYLTNQIKTKKKYTLNDEQKEFIKKLQLDGIVKDIYKIKFNTMRMHTKETIMEGIALITTFEENKNQLILFTKRINQLLLNNTKEKLKTAIQKSKKITKHTKKRCVIEINKIASDLQLDTETSLTKIQIKLVKTNRCDVFCDKLINRISYISTNPIRRHKLSSIIRTIKKESKKEEINRLYVTLIASLKLIIDKKHKLDEKRLEVESKNKYIGDHIYSTKKGIMANIKAGTLKERAAMQSKKNLDHCEDIVYSFLDVVLETKGMIVDTEALVYEILKEMK